MDPLRYKAHPLLETLVLLLTRPEQVNFAELAGWGAFLIVATAVWAFLLIGLGQRAAGRRLSFFPACGLVFPALILYLPLMLTALSDVMEHAFVLKQRYILLLALAVASQMLSLWYGVLLTDRQGPIGLYRGLTIALGLLLFSIPFCVAVLIVEKNFP